MFDLIEQTLYNLGQDAAAGRSEGCWRQVGNRRANGDPPLACLTGTGEDGARHSEKSYGELCQGAEVNYALIGRNWQLARSA